jgi:pSer/pThr/pTyr-binding forkhead associated (FHA) protein
MNFAPSRAVDKINWVRGMFKLELKLQDLTIKEYSLQDGDNLSIGRLSGNDIVVREKSVSRKHASIARQKDSLVISDKGSKNGIIVNGTKVQSAELKDGDIVWIGSKYHLKMTISAAKERRSSPTTEPNLDASTGSSSLDAVLEWYKNGAGTWWTLAEANVEDAQFDDMEGVYVIWYDDQNHVTLRVGHGHIRDCIVRERNDEEMWQHAQQHEIYLTWAKVDRKYQEVVAKYIAKAAKPKLKSTYGDVGVSAVNLPWYNE